MLIGLLIGITLTSFIIFVNNPHNPRSTGREAIHRSYLRLISLSVFIITLCVLFGYIISELSK